MDQTCRHCNAKHFIAEENVRHVYSKCCANGKVQLAPLGPHPLELRQLFKNGHRLSRQFKTKVNVYNNCFAFASIQTNHQHLPGRGPYVYIIQGQMYHAFSDVNVNRDRQQCGPLYFLDPQEAARQRIENARDHGFDVNEELMNIITPILNRVNPFAQGYRTLRQQYEMLRLNNPNAILDVYLEFKAHTRDAPREEALPQVQEIAAVRRTDDGLPINHNLTVFLAQGDNNLKYINQQSDVCDPLCYPLLFPNGDRGWNMHIRVGQHHVTLKDYYAYRFAVRFNDDNDHDENHFDIFRYAGPLTQKFIVDAYLKVEWNRLHYIRTHQDRMRAEEYEGLRDYLRNRADVNNVGVGRMVVLPSSFIGGMRSQMQRYQDAMSVVTTVGYPTLFITMTCNPKWPEIIRNIPQGDQPSNHPLLIARVFEVKFKAMLNELVKDRIMGKVIAHLAVIEFQKRGLPHAHILLTMCNEDRPLEPERIDQLISAEIPDPDEEHQLYELVGTHMIHGPCGPLDRSCVCMRNDVCSKKFPKSFRNETAIINGKVYYRRSRNGRTIEVNRRGTTLEATNDFVVPYNPYLLFKYRTHINVEICTTLGSVKYLYKYFFKGDDMALLEVVHQQLDHDEVTSFLRGRYMTPPEAAWHLLSFPLFENSHHVERLPVHMPGRHAVLFRDGQEREAVGNNERSSRLLQFFQTNLENPEARQWLYSEFPLHFVWVDNRRCWRRRQIFTKPTIGRIFNVSLRSGELYYLRLLLLHVRGPTSFENLRTVNERVCDTFLEACRERNLLAEDVEWRRSLTEARERAMPQQLRKMFAYILLFGVVEDPVALWQTFKTSMFEDYTRARPNRPALDEQQAENRALIIIQSILRTGGKRLADFNLPEPQQEQADQTELENNDPLRDRPVQEMIDHLNANQRDVFNLIIRASLRDDEPRRLINLIGAAGTGKTFLCNTSIKCLNEIHHVNVVTVAWTGLAASLLLDGRTVHSRFKLPLNIEENTTSSITLQSEEGTFLRNAKLIIWDEISMTTRLAFEIVDKTLRFLCSNDRPFGGKCVVVCGDFKQCLPVVIGGDRTAILGACVKANLQLWGQFECIKLLTNMRVQGEQENFVEWLEQLGNGTLVAERVPRAQERSIISLPDCCIVDNLEMMIQRVFGDLHTAIDQPINPNRAILTPLNEHCHEINEIVLNRLASRSNRIYESADCLESENETMIDEFPIEFLNNLTPSGFPKHRLHLKEGCIVMLLKNFNVRHGLCNGTRLIVRQLGDSYIEAEQFRSDGQPAGETIFIPRVDFTSESDRTLPFTLRRRQFPLRPAYGITINKAQGQTLGTVGIYLPRPVFQHGQLYVAFSRATSLNHISALVIPGPNQGKLIAGDNTVHTKNIVYKEVL